MSHSDVAGWIYLTSDAVVTTRPCLLHSVTVRASASGGIVSLYEGRDASSGRIVDVVAGAATVSTQIVYPTPLLLARGLFVDFGSNVTSAQVSYTPLGSDVIDES